MKKHTPQEKQALQKITQVIHDLRSIKQLSQRQLSEKSGVHLDTIVRVECGQYSYSIPVLLKFAKVFDTTLSSIFETADL